VAKRPRSRYRDSRPRHGPAQGAKQAPALPLSARGARFVPRQCGRGGGRGRRRRGRRWGHGGGRRRRSWPRGWPASTTHAVRSRACGPPPRARGGRLGRFVLGARRLGSGTAPSGAAVLVMPVERAGQPVGWTRRLSSASATPPSTWPPTPSARISVMPGRCRGVAGSVAGASAGASPGQLPGQLLGTPRWSSPASSRRRPCLDALLVQRAP
jgi:hypothetical protein